MAKKPVEITDNIDTSLSKIEEVPLEEIKAKESKEVEVEVEVEEPSSEGASMSAASSEKPVSKSKRYFWLGLVIGIILAIGLVAYPTYLGFQLGESQQLTLKEVVSENLQLKIASSDAKLNRLQAQLAEVIIAEKEYEELIAKKETLQAAFVKASAESAALKKQASLETKPLIEQASQTIKENIKSLF